MARAASRHQNVSSGKNQNRRASWQAATSARKTKGVNIEISGVEQSRAASASTASAHQIKRWRAIKAAHQHQARK